MLLDCCAAASSVCITSQGLVEVLAASGIGSTAPVGGPYTFTANLIQELQDLLDKNLPPIPVAHLHGRLMYRMKQHLPIGEIERSRTPHHYYLAHGKTIRSIPIGPWAPKESGSTSTSSLGNSTSGNEGRFGRQVEAANIYSQIWPDVTFQHDKVLIAISLSSDVSQDLDSRSWQDWLRQIPALVDCVNVEAAYRSRSTLLLVSMPIAIWNLLPESEATSFIGFISSPNLRYHITPESEVPVVETKTAPSAPSAIKGMSTIKMTPRSGSPLELRSRPAPESPVGRPQFNDNPFRWDRWDPPRKHVASSDGAPIPFTSKSVSHPLPHRSQRQLGIYKPLAAGVIRILTLQPGTGDESLSAVLEEQSLPLSKDALPYDMLSYYWDPNEPLKRISILQSDSTSTPSSSSRPGHFYLKSNLQAALNALRYSKGTRRLFVDALSINQEDAQEKSRLVSRPPEILQKAECVYAWLGPGNETTKAAFDCLRNLLYLGKLGAYLRIVTPQTWKATANLVNNIYFTQRRNVPDLFLAKQVIICCGHQAMSWPDFADAVSIFTSIPHDMGLNNSTQHFRHFFQEGFLPMKTGSYVMAIVLLMQGHREEPSEVIPPARLLSLEVLVTCLFPAFATSDGRDSIFSLLDVAKSPSNWQDPIQHTTDPFAGVTFSSDSSRTHTMLDDGRLSRDYSKSLVDVLVDFIDYCIETSHSLDILCRHWAPTSPELPSQAKTGLPFSKAEALPSWIQKYLDHQRYGIPEMLGFFIEQASLVSTDVQPG